MWFRSAVNGTIGHGFSAAAIAAAKIGFVIGPVAISSGTVQFPPFEAALDPDSHAFEASEGVIEALAREEWGDEPVLTAGDGSLEESPGAPEEGSSGPGAGVLVAALTGGAPPAVRTPMSRGSRAAAPLPRAAASPSRAPAASRPAAERSAPSSVPVALGPFVRSAPPASALPPAPAASPAPSPIPSPVPPAASQEAESGDAPADPVPEEREAGPCGLVPPFPEGAACGSGAVRVYSAEDLGAYSENFGFDGTSYSSLIVDFDLQAEGLRILSPCDLTVAQGVTIGIEGDACLEAAGDIHLRLGSWFAASGAFGAYSEGGSFTLGQSAALEAGSLTLSAPFDVNLFSGSHTLVAGAAEVGGGDFLMGISASLEAAALRVAATESAWLRRGSATDVAGEFEMSAPLCTVSPLATVEAAQPSGTCFTPPP